MHMKKRGAAAALALLLLVGISGCLAWQARNAPVSVKYYAALGDYNRAKGAAVVYASAPSTPVEHVEAIIKVVDATDAELEKFEEIRKLGLPKGDDRYTAAAQLLRYATQRLDAKIAEGGR